MAHSVVLPKPLAPRTKTFLRSCGTTGPADCLMRPTFLMLMILFNVFSGRFVCGLSAAALPYQNDCRVRYKVTWRGGCGLGSGDFSLKRESTEELLPKRLDKAYRQRDLVLRDTELVPHNAP